MRLTIHVRPGAGRPSVGGEHDGALIVRVTARAVGGQATEAALAAVADAFGVRRRAVSLVTGRTSRAIEWPCPRSDSISAVPRNPVEPEIRMRMCKASRSNFHATALAVARSNEFRKCMFRPFRNF